MQEFADVNMSVNAISGWPWATQPAHGCHCWVGYGPHCVGIRRGEQITQTHKSQQSGTNCQAENMMQRTELTYV